MPKAVAVPCGEITVTLPPTPTPEPARQPAADGDPVAAEIVERALHDMVGDELERAQVLGPDAAHQRPGRAGVGRRHDLPLDHREGRGDAGDLPDLRQRLLIIGKPAGHPVDAEIAVEAEDAAQKVGAEPVHHRHDDDQGGDAERDPQEREDRDHRDEPLLPPRPQIAERDHPLEGVEDHVGTPSTKGRPDPPAAVPPPWPGSARPSTPAMVMRRV